MSKRRTLCDQLLDLSRHEALPASTFKDPKSPVVSNNDFQLETSSSIDALGIYTGLSMEEKNSLNKLGWQITSGKVRQLIKKQNHLFMLHTDRLTAFDRHIAYVPYKGQILAELNSWWLQQARTIVPNHYLDSPHPRLLDVKAAVPFKVEVVVRGFMAGSLERSYGQGVRKVCGLTLPDGLKAYDPLPQLLITPTTKAAAFEHDVEITPAEITNQGICSAQQWQEIEALALKLFRFGSTVYEQHGWLLVDTKYEFGMDQAGKILVIDEIHTPDSSRLWHRSTYEDARSSGRAPDMFDKEIVRRWLLKEGFQGVGPVPTVPNRQLIELALVYLEVTEQLLDRPLFGVGGPPLDWFEEAYTDRV